MKIFLFIKQLLLKTIHENIYEVLVMMKKSNSILFKVQSSSRDGETNNMIILFL